MPRKPHEKLPAKSNELEGVTKVRQKFDVEASAYYATARLWDDGILDPRETRMALTVGLSMSYNRDWVSQGAPRYGVFRM